MVRYLLFISILLVLESCILDHKLTMLQTRNESKSLRLDGIYLHEDSLDIVDMFYLYQDGTILSRGSIAKDRLESKLADLEVSTKDKYKSMKFLWGRYTIEGNVIKFQKWGISDKNYIRFTKEGKIINDTTFLINKFYNKEGEGLIKLNEIYRFRAMSSKPDSVNRWVGFKKN